MRTGCGLDVVEEVDKTLRNVDGDLAGGAVAMADIDDAVHLEITLRRVIQTQRTPRCQVDAGDACFNHPSERIKYNIVFLI